MTGEKDLLGMRAWEEMVMTKREGLAVTGRGLAFYLCWNSSSHEVNLVSTLG